MSGIFRFQPSDLGTPTVQGGDVANAFFNTFLAVRQSERADAGIGMEQQRIDISKAQLGMQQEEQDYEIQTLRPLREAQAQLGLMSGVLGVRSQQQQLQMGALELGSQLKQKQTLDSIMGEMTSYSADQGKQTAGVLGKVTSYGYNSDPYGDSASLGTGEYKVPTGAWNNKLDELSMAVSPDVERQFQQLGINQDDMVELTLDDGSRVTRRWSDRTMQDKQATEKFGAPLTGRFDFYNKKGPDPMDGRAVTAFRRATPADQAMAAPGVPAYAEVAGGTEPVKTAAKVFSPQQLKWLQHYNVLQSIASSAGNSPDGQQARMLMSQLEQNPEFSKTLGERNLLLKAAQNQAAMTASMMGASQPQMANFQATHPQYKLNVMPNGQIVPVNALTGQYLDAQQQVGFMSAWETHQKNFDPYRVDQTAGTNKIPTGVLNAYYENVGKYAAGQSIPANATDDESRKIKVRGIEALASMVAAEAQFPTLGAERRQKEAMAAAERAKQPAAAPAPPVDTTVSMTVSELLAQRGAKQKAELELAQMEDLTATVNTFAADLAEKQGVPVKAVNIANDILKGGPVDIPEGEQPDLSSMPSGPKRSLASSGKMDAAEFYAKQFGVPVDQIKRWAQATVRSAAQAATPAGLTPEQQAFMDKIKAAQ